MLKSAPDSRPSKPTGLKYFFADPIRMLAMACAVALMATPGETPLWLVVAAIAISQANGIAMIVGIVGNGWTRQWGRRGREAVFTSSLAGDWTNTSVCTMVGAMLLLRWFDRPEMVLALGLLGLGIAGAFTAAVAVALLVQGASLWRLRSPHRLACPGGHA